MPPMLPSPFMVGLTLKYVRRKLIHYRLGKSLHLPASIITRRWLKIAGRQTIGFSIPSSERPWLLPGPLIFIIISWTLVPHIFINNRLTTLLPTAEGIPRTVLVEDIWIGEHSRVKNRSILRWTKTLTGATQMIEWTLSLPSQWN